MSYAELYETCQSFDVYVKRNKIRDIVLSLTKKEKITPVRTGLDINVCRGFYISATNQEHQFVKQCGSDVIVLARDNNPCWERFVYIKELMHAFDNVDERASSPDSFELMLTELSGQYATMKSNWSPQFESELSCFWKALAVLCPQKDRDIFTRQLADSQIDEYGIALKLKIPQQIVRHLFSPHYENIIKTMLV